MVNTYRATTAVFWNAAITQPCFSFVFWVVYLAFEPFVRRRWPGRIVSWNRVLAGGFRDPLVGRDILIGAVFGLGVILFNFYLAGLVPQWLGYPPAIPWFDFPATQLLGIRSFAFGITQQIFACLFQSFILLFFLLLMYIIFYPVTSDFSAWYAADFVLALLIALALAGFAFHTSLAGQPLFRATLPDD